MGKGDDIQERLIDFAVEVMELCDALPKTFAGRHIGEQLFRAGTAGAANYAEARGSESKNDFIHKLGIVRKELNVTNSAGLSLQVEKRRKRISGKVRLAGRMLNSEIRFSCLNSARPNDRVSASPFGRAGIRRPRRHCSKTNHHPIKEKLALPVVKRATWL